MQDFSQRLDFLRVTISKKIGIGNKISDFLLELFKLKNTANYSKWKLEGRIPKKHLKTLVEKYNVNESWLKDGTGEMFYETESKINRNKEHQVKQHSINVGMELDFSDRLEYLRLILSKRHQIGSKVSDFVQNVFDLKYPSSYTRWKSDGKIPEKYLIILKDDYDVSPSWLTDGIGEIFIKGKSGYTGSTSTSIAADDGGINYLLQIIKENADKLAEKDREIMELKREIARLKKIQKKQKDKE